MASPRPGPADHGGTHHKRAAAASYRVGAAVALLALLLATAAPRGATAAGSGLPVPTWGWGRWGGGGEGPVGAVAEAVKAYPGVFATARARLALKDPGSEGSLSRTNGLFSIDVHDICPMVTEVTSISSSVSCLAMSTLETALRNRRAPGTPLECSNANETGFGEQVQPSRVSMLDGSPAPTPLPDLRPMPPSFSARRTRALMYNEGGTWAWNWGVINNILLFSMCARGGGGSQDFMVPEGWSTVGPGTGQLPGIYDLIQTDGSPPMPFMAILKTKAKRGIGSGAGLGRTTNATGSGVWTSGANGLLSIYSSHSAGDGAADAERWDAYSKADNKDSGSGKPAGLEGEVDSQDGQLAIVFRGTNSGPEWMLDFQYHRIPRALFPGPYFNGNFFEGETHAGFTAVFNMVWPHVRAALEREVLSGPKLRHVTVSGHSLGAAVATLVSYAAQRFLDAHNAGVTVSAMLVAAPNAGNLAFVQSHAALVNTRRITFVNDVITMVPCPGTGVDGRGMPACNTKASQGGKVSVWTGYYPGYGSITIGAKDMPVQVAAWENTNRLPLFDVPTAEALAGALHVCAYECFFSRWSDSQRGAQSSCLLVPPTLKESSAHSFCFGFPTAGFDKRK